MAEESTGGQFTTSTLKPAIVIHVPVKQVVGGLLAVGRVCHASRDGLCRAGGIEWVGDGRVGIVGLRFGGGGGRVH